MCVYVCVCVYLCLCVGVDVWVGDLELSFSSDTGFNICDRQHVLELNALHVCNTIFFINVFLKAHL